MAAGIVVVFDFDKTIIDCDSDNWVVDELGFTDLFNRLLPTMPWNTLMDRMMTEMHSSGVTINDITKALQRVPIHPRVVPAVKAAHVAGCDLRIVSDANRFFIETVLDHLGLRNCFSEINTNPGYVDQGRLRILPFHDFKRCPHGSDLCPPNMCKGVVIQRLLSEHGSKRFIYLGDGAGDYCPSIKLRAGDRVMPRKNFPVWDLISQNPKLVTAEVREWIDGADLERVLLSLIASVRGQQEEEGEGEEAANNKVKSNAAADTCRKFETLPIGSREVLPQALPVLQ